MDTSGLKLEPQRRMCAMVELQQTPENAVPEAVPAASGLLQLYFRFRQHAPRTN